jgi:hypothetical protein
MNTDYQPNFKDPRVLKRVKQAYGASFCLSTTKPRRWSQKFFDKHFGQDHKFIGKWLREKLLICTDNHYSMSSGKCKEYVLSEAGKNSIRSILKGEIYKDQSDDQIFTQLKDDRLPSDVNSLFDYQVVREWVLREHTNELRTGDFKYEDKSDRLWNTLQFISTKFRDPLMQEAGFNHTYDIVASAPTLIHQFAQQNDMDLYLPALRTYLEDRTTARQSIAESAGITIKQSKILINALFCGARLGVNRDFSLFHLLDRDADKIRKLQANTFITQLKADIKTCWTYIEPTLTRIEVTDQETGKTRKIPLNSKRKWGCYFRLERKVLDVVRTYLTRTNNPHFLEHDGWRTKNPVNKQELIEFITEQTGFNLNLDGE